jgi:hypothetical protein
MKLLRRSPLSILLPTVFLALAALPAMAGNLDTSLDSFLADATGPDYLAFTLTLGTYTPPQVDAEGYLVGLVQGVLTDTVTGNFSDPFYMFCSDFLHGTTEGATYDITIHQLVGADTDVPDPNPPGLGLDMQTLQEQALVGTNFGLTPSGTTDFNANIQHEIWNMSGATPPFDEPDPVAMAALFATAAAEQPTANFSNAFVFEPVSEADGQAFMPVNPGGFNTDTTPSTPEPSTLVMFGFGLAGLGAFRLRRKSQR